MYLCRTKSLLLNAYLQANKYALNKHLVKVIVPISRSAKGVLNIETPVASLSSTIASIAYSRATTTFVNKKSGLDLTQEETDKLHLSTRSQIVT